MPDVTEADREAFETFALGEGWTVLRRGDAYLGEIVCFAWAAWQAALARAPAEIGWRPIETAPKDGREFLVYEEGAVFAASFDGEGTLLSHCGQPVVYPPEPTHWHPRLAAPEPPAPTRAENAQVQRDGERVR